jgi:hypothetical protein
MFISLAILYINSQHGENLHDRGIVEVFASPCHNGGSWNKLTVAAKNVLDFGNDTFYISENAAEEVIGYDFKTMRVCPTHYSLRSSGHGVNGANPKSWKIEVSDDILAGWVQIDQRIFNSELNTLHKRELCAVQHPLNRCYHYIRLTQTGPNLESSHHISLTGFEVFGNLTQV